MERTSAYAEKNHPSITVYSLPFKGLRSLQLRLALALRLELSQAEVFYARKAGFSFVGIDLPERKPDVRERLSGCLHTSRLEITAVKL